VILVEILYMQSEKTNENKYTFLLTLIILHHIVDKSDV